MSDHSIAIEVQMDAESVVTGLQEMNETLQNLPGDVQINLEGGTTSPPYLTRSTAASMNYLRNYKYTSPLRMNSQTSSQTYSSN
ncbi:hypothetical protein [Methanothermobacter sp. THM-1]|uniref:hypothetical protein n=1 Tax=Methanothermobacter sp. THM-1 TaxID=2606911 RepID=UPI00192DF000|nr:hypothetical protein [Methanothermobacter sp. THM-1]